jgi:cytochrome c oxidase assembly protein subunit 11
MTPPQSTRIQRINWQMFGRLSLFAVVMFGFGYAMVPYYKKFCEVTGINNLLQRDTVSKNTQIDTSRWVTLEFDANTHGMPWQFAPVQRSVRVHPGEMAQVEFEIKNEGSATLVGQAIPSYGPKHGAAFVKKLECFCFKQQVLAAGETRRMPVQFVIDAALPASVTTLTLSYTFFEVPAADKKNAVAPAAASASGKAG